MLRRPPPAKKAALNYQPIPSDPPEPLINSNPDEWRITMVSEIISIFLMNPLLLLLLITPCVTSGLTWTCPRITNPSSGSVSNCKPYRTIPVFVSRWTLPDLHYNPQ